MFIELPTAPGALRRTTPMVHATITHEQLFTVMGENLLFQTNTPLLLAAAQDAFGRFPPVHDPNQQPLVLQLFVHDKGESLSSMVYPKAVYHTMGHLFYFNLGAENTIVVDLAQGYGFGYVTPAVASNCAFVRYTFIETAAYAMLGLARNFVAIHAACVVKDGVSVMIQGKAGAGKSTLAFACLRRGFQVLSEDVVQVKVTPSALRLWGTPWKFHLLADSLRFFPELADHQLAMQVNGEWKVEVELDALFPGSTLTQARPGPIVFLERATGDRPTGYERLGLAEARQLFDVVWAWSIGWTEEYEQGLAGLLDKGSYRLCMNGTPWEAVDALEALIAEWKAGCKA